MTMRSTLASLLALASSAALLSSGGNAILAPAAAFSSPLHPMRSARTAAAPAVKFSPPEWRSSAMRRPRTRALYGSGNDDGPSSDGESSLFDRFLSPRMDDPGLPLTDALLAQVVAPTLQIYWIVLNHAPTPSWLKPVSSYLGQAPELAPRGSLLAPALIHGAGLAVCWLAGALAAKSFEREAFILGEGGGRSEGDADDESAASSSSGIWNAVGRYDTVVLRLVQAGAFASGILIVSTQLDLLSEFGGRYVQYGESDETDLRLVIATVEVINDIFWEALVIGSWRIIHANYMSSPNNWTRRF